MNKTALVGVAALVAISTALSLTGCGGGSDPLANDKGDTSAGADSALIIGSADFAESQIIANIYSQALQNAGVKVKEQFNIGSREVTMAALKDGSLDVMPEYSSSLLKYLDQKSTASAADEVQKELTAKLPKELSLLDVSEAADNDVVAVTKATAEKYNLTKISDLAAIGSQITLGGPPEWKTRVNGVIGLHDLYGITFKEFVTLDAGGPLTMTALTSGQVQAGDIFSTDPGIEANNLVVLKDDKSLFAAENVVPVITSARASEVVKKTLNGVSAKLTTDDLITMNGKAATGAKQSDIAKEWLKSVGLI